MRNGITAVVVGIIAVVGGLFLWNKYGNKNNPALVPSLEVDPGRAMPTLFDFTKRQLSGISLSDLKLPDLTFVPTPESVKSTLSSILSLPNATPKRTATKIDTNPDGSTVWQQNDGAIVFVDPGYTYNPNPPRL